MLDLNQLDLPSDVRDKLAELDLELSEGDITQKGYDKKRTKLLAPYLNLNDNLINKKNENKPEINHHISRQTVTEHHRNQLNYHNNQLNNYIGGNVYGQAGTNNLPSHHFQQNHHNLHLSSNIISSPQTRAKRKQRRVTRNESRYHSEVRKEAVQQAIAAMKHKPKSALPMPSKRTSNLSNRNNKDQRNKCNLRSNKPQLPAQRSLLQRGQSTNHSSGHGTTGDTDEYESTDDDYDDDEDDLIDLRNETSSSDTQELNVQNRMTNLKLTHQQHQQLNSSSEEQEACSTASSTNERNLILSKHHISSSAAPPSRIKQQPLPPKVIGVQESANKYLKRYENSKNYNHLKSTSNQSPQTQLFQLKENNQRNKHSSSTSKNLNYSNTPPINNNLISNEDNPPALPQHQTKINYNQQQNKFDERPPERTPVRKNSKQQTTVNLIENATTAATDDLISFEPASIDSFNNEQRHQNLNTMLSSGSNNSSSNNNTSLSNGGGLIDEFSSLNNQNCSSIDNLPPEYDQVYQSSHDPQQILQDNQGNRSPSNRSRLSNDTSYSTGTGRYKVSAKIQQLLNTLKRPKKRPLDDFYKDDDFDQQASIDPNAPKPEGHTMTPIVGEQLQIPSGLPKTLEEALQRYGSATFKASAVTVLDTNGKISPALTYGKLWSRSKKIAYNLLNKVGQKRSNLNDAMPLKAGDRIALVFPNNDPINFICAFYGCLCAGIVPVSVEVPITRRDSDSLQIGFLLGSCKVNYAITSEACFKGLPKTQAGEVHTFKGWPKLNWLVPDNWNKPPKDWLPPTRISEESVAYIEYTMDREGSIKGVAIPRTAMIKHCKALTNACLYTEGDIMVCTENFKREVGLYHSVLTSVLNGIHVIFIPYSLMKISPSTWLQMITKYKATTAICKSRDLHWGLLSSKEAKDINLASLRMLLVSDGCNPWSLSSIDSFGTAFNSKGLKCESLCTNASSTEAMTVSIRRPGRVGIGATGRGVLSMNDLSYNVIRVDTENSLTSLTLQDCGHILPSTQAAVVKINGNTRCKTDEVGEICVSGFNECFYEGLNVLSENHFKMEILNSDGTVYGDQKYVRSGLLGFTGPGGLIFVCGTRDGLIQCSGRYHNSDDLVATVLAVEPMKFVYRGRIAIFSIKVLKDQRICVIAEQRPDCTEEQSFQWMSKVLQAIDSIHHVGIYCLALVQPNHLPRTPLGGIHMPEIKRKFLEGNLHPINILMCPHLTCTNLPAPRETPEIGAASRMVGCLVQGNKLASADGRELGPANDDPSILLGDKDEFSISNRCQYINEILKWRASTSPDHNLFTLINSKGVEQSTLTCMQLHKRAERIANLLVEKGKVNSGDHVALVFQPGIELICAFYACLYVGAVPITIKPPSATNLANTLPTVKMIVDVSKSTIILSNSPIIKFLKTKEAVAIVELKNWPTILDIEDATKKRFNALYKAPTSEMIAYLDFSISSSGLLAGVKISHSATTSLCKSMKLACELYPSRHIALCLEPYSGLGFILWCLSSIWSGHHSILIPPNEVESNPSIWLTTLSQYKVRDTFCSYGIMELCTKEPSIQQLKSRNIDLTCVRTCIVVSEERPRVALTNSFTKLFSSLGLSNRAVSTSFGCRVNIAMCLQGASSRDLETVYIDQRALRNDRITLVEKGSPHSLCLIESGKLLPGVSVIIANPDTKGHLGECNLGEIWVKSSFNSSGYVCVGDEETNFHNNEKFFAAKPLVSTVDANATYARTGYLGFIRKSESTQADTSEEHDEIYIVGALDETIMLRGMRYHPIDIENSVLRCHKKIGECAIFTWTNLLVVVAELNGNENEALDLVPLITNVVLEDHQIIVGVVVIVDPNTIENNSGEKQRVILRDRFLQDKLNPIYVAYNM